MKTGKLELTGQGPSPIAGAARAGPNNAGSGGKERKPNPSSPSMVQTPQEALAYIDLLYKTGHMEEAAALLRRSEIFREAWLILQRSLTTCPETPAGLVPAKLAEAREPASIPDPVLPPESLKGQNPAGKLACTFAQALQIYQSQLVYYDQDRNSQFRISLRV